MSRTGAFTGYAYLYLTQPLQIGYVSNVVAVVTIVMHCTMTCLQDGKYCGDSYPPGSLGIRDAGWEKGVYCLLSICFC